MSNDLPELDSALSMPERLNRMRERQRYWHDKLRESGTVQNSSQSRCVGTGSDSDE